MIKDKAEHERELFKEEHERKELDKGSEQGKEKREENAKNGGSSGNKTKIGSTKGH